MKARPGDLAVLFAASAAMAEHPDRPITIVVPLAAGD